MLSIDQERFLNHHKIAHLATVDDKGHPHVVPVCFVLLGKTIYIVLDDKPKTVDVMSLKRVRNISGNPYVSLVVDHYEDDWEKLGWVMIRGQAMVREVSELNEEVIQLLRSRYTQYRTMNLENRVLIVIEVEKAVSWGIIK